VIFMTSASSMPPARSDTHRYEQAQTDTRNAPEDRGSPFLVTELRSAQSRAPMVMPVTAMPWGPNPIPGITVFMSTWKRGSGTRCCPASRKTRTKWSVEMDVAEIVLVQEVVGHDDALSVVGQHRHLGPDPGLSSTSSRRRG